MSAPQRFKFRLKVPAIITPKGEASYPKLHKPALKYNSQTEYEYSVNLILGPEEAAAAIKSLQPHLDAVWAEATGPGGCIKPAVVKQWTLAVPWKPHVDDDGNETGGLVLKIKQAAVIKDSPVKIALFDAARKPLHTPIGYGSIIKVRLRPRPYAMVSTKTCGLTLSFDAVQVLDLKSGGSSDRPDGFEEEEGYVAPTEEPEGPGGTGGGEDGPDL